MVAILSPQSILEKSFAGFPQYKKNMSHKTYDWVLNGVQKIDMIATILFLNFIAVSYCLNYNFLFLVYTLKRQYRYWYIRTLVMVTLFLEPSLGKGSLKI